MRANEAAANRARLRKAGITKDTPAPAVTVLINAGAEVAAERLLPASEGKTWQCGETLGVVLYGNVGGRLLEFTVRVYERAAP